MENKIVIVTGAAQGIGLACAKRFSRDGARVVIADVNEAKGEAAAKELGSGNGEALFIKCDVADRFDIRNLLASTLTSLGEVDVLVNNAGIVDNTPFLDLGEEEFDRVIATNLKGGFLMGQAVAKQMVKRVKDGGPAGAIINMSSVNAFFAMPDHAAYSITKGGIAQLTKAMALALAEFGIRVNAVGPGSIMTPMLETVVHDAEIRRRVLSRTPLGRIGDPAEIAAVVRFLASEDASYITGETIFADGGRLPLNYTVPVREK